MTEVYRDQSMEALFKTYLEAQEVGAVGLCDKIWEKLTELDRRETKEKLKELRDELNQSLGHKV